MLIFDSLAGVLTIVIAAAAFWYFMPRNGKVHPWVTKPYPESTIPLAIMAGFTFGLAAIGAVVLPMMLGAE
jgi:hypothetical protein